MHAPPTPSNHPVVLSLSALLGFFLLLIDSQPPSQLPWKSSLESRVNEFAITIFHVDVTTYSLVDFGKTRSVLVAYVWPRIRSHPRLPSRCGTLRFSLVNLSRKPIMRGCSNVGIHLVGNTLIYEKTRTRARARAVHDVPRIVNRTEEMWPFQHLSFAICPKSKCDVYNIRTDIIDYLYSTLNLWFVSCGIFCCNGLCIAVQSIGAYISVNMKL